MTIKYLTNVHRFIPIICHRFISNYEQTFENQERQCLFLLCRIWIQCWWAQYGRWIHILYAKQQMTHTPVAMAVCTFRMVSSSTWKQNTITPMDTWTDNNIGLLTVCAIIVRYCFVHISVGIVLLYMYVSVLCVIYRALPTFMTVMYFCSRSSLTVNCAELNNLSNNF